MYDKLIKNLRHDSVSALQNCEFDFVHDWMLQAADAIEDLENRLNLWRQDKIRRWVPVTERLPKIDKKHHCSKDVLAYFKDGGMCFTALEENIFGQTWFECERHPAFEEEMIVTHWMPLPKPPESDGE